LAITWRLHTQYHPQSSGQVEQANGLIKQQLTKLSLELRISWVDLLPLALTRLRVVPRQPTGLSPFELLYGHPFLLSHTFPSNTPPLTGYLPYLTLLCSLLQVHTDRYLPQSDAVPPDHGPLSPGNHILLKQLHPKPLQPQWMGPYTVILTTPSAVKLLGHPAWYHVTRLKKLPPTDSTKTWWVTQVGPTSLWISRVGDISNAASDSPSNPI
jgi:hypothetical protein